MRVFESYNGVGMPSFLMVLCSEKQDQDNWLVQTIIKIDGGDNSDTHNVYRVPVDLNQSKQQAESIILEIEKLKLRRTVSETSSDFQEYRIKTDLKELSIEEIIARRYWGSFEFLKKYKSHFNPSELQEAIAELTTHPRVY